MKLEELLKVLEPGTQILVRNEKNVLLRDKAYRIWSSPEMWLVKPNNRLGYEVKLVRRFANCLEIVIKEVN